MRGARIESSLILMSISLFLRYFSSKWWRASSRRSCARRWCVARSFILFGAQHAQRFGFRFHVSARNVGTLDFAARRSAPSSRHFASQRRLWQRRKLSRLLGLRLCLASMHRLGLIVFVLRAAAGDKLKTRLVQKFESALSGEEMRPEYDLKFKLCKEGFCCFLALLPTRAQRDIARQAKWSRSCSCACNRSWASSSFRRCSATLARPRRPSRTSSTGALSFVRRSTDRRADQRRAV